MYKQTTNHIQVTVEPIFLDDQSQPTDNYYVWAYRVWIENRSRDTIQLVSRHWRITDANGFTQEVQGEGVIGEHPVIGPNEIYHYTSGTPLSTPSGIMQGKYRVQSTNGQILEVTIPPFSLDSPYELATIN